MNRAIQRELNLPGAHPPELLRRKEFVYDHAYRTGTLIETVFGAGEISAGDLAVIHRHAEVLEQFSAADGAGLVAAANGAHALGKQDNPAAAPQDARNLLNGIDIRRKVLFRNDLQKPEDARQMRTEKFVVSGNIVQRVRQQYGAGIDIIQTRSMVADNNVRPLVFSRIVFYFRMDIELFKVQQFPEITENAVDQFGRLTEFSRVELLLQRTLAVWHIVSLPQSQKNVLCCAF
ncbi:hypothetical protein SDC9_143379 [bioreactor metagenome]|uniref:Uncharacterized protein n=1 Tax=bioreactor metagenome TaxID=1076179 RepID=A0A645E3T8_9ZZZZ